MNSKDLPTKKTRRNPLAFLDARGQRVLNDEQRRFFITLMGQYMNATEIREEIKKKYDIDIKNIHSMMFMYGKSKKWIPILERLRLQFTNSLHEVGGSYKRVRMERRERLYERALKKNDVKNALIAVKHMEDEMEGKGQASFNLTLNQYNMMSDQELDERRLALLEKINPKVIEVKKES